MSKVSLFFLLFGLFLYSCKSLKQSSNTTDLRSDSTYFTLAPSDTIPEIEYYLTTKGDTLLSLDETVDIELNRVYRDTLTLAAVGDIMMGTNFPNTGYLPKDGGYRLWNDVGPILINHDITFGNLEGVILSDGGEQKECKNSRNCYLFRTPDELSFHFKENGFDLLSLANNHANDFGPTGRRNTQDILDSLKIAHAGSIERPSGILKGKGYKIGFVGFAPNKGTISIHDYEFAISQVKRLDSITDIVVVSFHAGAEGPKHQHVPRKHEFYFGEDRGNVYEFAHVMIDAGADVILGHGPHVVRAIEVYKERFIAYSLGNFLTYGRFNLRGPNAYAPIVSLKLDSNGRFIEGNIHSFIQDYTLGPIPDQRMRAAKKIKELSEIDFPENGISIDDMGRILYLHR